MALYRAWVDATEILPDADTTVLVYMPESDNPVDVGFYDGEFWFDYLGAALTGRNVVSHWMQLPDGPKTCSREVVVSGQNVNLLVNGKFTEGYIRKTPRGIGLLVAALIEGASDDVIKGLPQ